MRGIIFSDPHLEESAISELEEVFKEITSYKKRADFLICVGDYYDKKNPSSEEIEFGTKWVNIFKKEFGKFIMVQGNHPAISDKISSVKYLKHLDIAVVDDIILDEVYYGHFMIKESQCGFEEKITYADLEKIHSVNRFILGHQHSYQEHKLMLHPGSCRYVDFGEVQDKHKYIILVEDSNVLPIILNKVRPMYEVDKVEDLEKISANSCVRIVINDFEQFKKEVNVIETYRNKFYKFKVKFNFNKSVVSTPSTTGNTNEIIVKWLNTVSDPDVKKEILTELELEGIC